MKKIVVAAAVTALSGAAAVAGPSMSTKWNTTTLSLERCKDRAEDSMREARFKNVKVLQYSVFGERGDYSGMIRCATEKGGVFFVVAGPQVDRTNRYVDEISEGF